MNACPAVNYIIAFFFTVPSDEWSAPSTTGDKPPPLSRHTFTKIDKHRAVVFAGYDGKKKHNDTFVLDMEKWVGHLLNFVYMFFLGGKHNTTTEFYTL